MNRSLRVWTTAAAAVLGLIILPAAAIGAITAYRVSVANNGAQAVGPSADCAVSGDGRFVAFASVATTLVTNDTNGVQDIFVRDRSLGTTRRVSVSTTGAQAYADCYGPSISADGRFVAFYSAADSLVASDTNGQPDVFVHDLTLHTTVMASVSTSGTRGNYSSANPAISADGHHVAFNSNSTTLVDNDTNGDWDIFVRDLLDGTTERVSVATGGGQAGAGSQTSAISADGRYVAFMSRATNLVDGDTNATTDIFLRDRTAGTTERINLTSAGGQADHYSGYPSVSADGRFVAFQSEAGNIVAGNDNDYTNVYVRDRVASSTVLVSVAIGGAQNERDSYTPSISADGRYVAFGSEATTLVVGDTNGRGDVFVRDLLAGMTQRVSVTQSGGQGNAYSSWDALPAISANGRCVVFDSLASNLVAGDTNGEDDVFLADRGRLSISVTRSPSSSTKTYRRSHGKVKYTLSATVKDSRGVRIAGTRVYLEHSSNGRTGWHTAYTLTTNASGVASRTFTSTKRSTVYYRWHIHQSDVRTGKTTSKQKVVVK